MSVTASARFGRVLAVFQRLVAQRLARLSAAFAGKTAAVLDAFWPYSTKSPLLSVESGGLFGKRCGVIRTSASLNFDSLYLEDTVLSVTQKANR